jgi:PAP2 superfamily
MRVVLALAAAVGALAAPSPAGASAATQWNLNATNALIVNAGQAPPVSLMHLAMVHGAVFDAVNAIDGGYTPYLVSPAATPFDSQDAAAASAAYHVLVSIVPAQQPALKALYDAALDPSVIPDGPAKTRGIAVGLAAAHAMIEARMNDGRFGSPGFPVPDVLGPGVWRPVPPTFGNDLNGWIRNVTPFMIRSSSQFRTNGPWPLRSPQYAREFNEVKSVGDKDSTTRTQHQTDASLYWAVHAVATWSRIVRMLEMREGLSTADGARLYAELYLTGADSIITVWSEKAFWSFWRPITAIHEAETDGNRATEADSTWEPLVANPPYPDHPSGHLGVSGSFVETLQDFFHTDHMTWTDTAAGKTLTYTRLSDALNEIISVRVWSGIHFRNADEQSAELAKQVARWRKHHYFRPSR